MSNTVKIKNRKKKNEVKVNFKLWSIIFGVFIALIVCLSIWASFHYGVGVGTIGVRPVTPENADAAATESAAEYATGESIVVTPEQLEEMGYSVDDLVKEGAEGTAEEAEAPAGEAEAAEGDAQGDAE